MRLLSLLVVILLSACATLAGLQLDDRFGKPDSTRYDRPPAPTAASPDYWRDVRPVLDRRCVTCHACYDAPCQLNLASYEGITRGASATPVYWTAPRLIAERPTRLGLDADSPSAWRALGFFPVLNERQNTPEANLAASSLHRLLAMKRTHPGQRSGLLNDPDLDTSLDRQAICPSAEGLDDYARQHPTRGMPFALPPLSEQEHHTLSRWIETGAGYRPPPPLPAAVRTQIADWEAFLNGDSDKARLSARYIFEHWYIGHLWFPEMPGQYFGLVRSTTPPGEPLRRIATRRPYDDPGVARVWYRIERLETTPVAKTHMPLRLDPARLARLQQWFIAPDYRVSKLPDYVPEVAANPFVAFRELPIDARYRLMLDEAHFTVSGFMKGPVCRGQVALNSINDHFWVVFLNPDGAGAPLTQAIVERASPVMRMPAEEESTAGVLVWLRYAELEKKYAAARSEAVRQLGNQNGGPTLKDIWDGDGRNPNAALTIFRHFDSASVVRGLVGEQPQTAFVMGYPLLERMHYLLVAGFDVFGNVGHQLMTRMYMDFLRMEGEMNFLALLPQAERQQVLARWYRQRSDPHNRYLADANAYFPQETGIRYRSNDRLGELYQMLRRHTAGVREAAHTLEASGLQGRPLEALQRLATLRGIAASLLPEDSLVAINHGPRRLAVVAMLRNSAHSNVSEMFSEEKRRLPQEDSLSVLNGVVGAYPNALFAVDAEKLPIFVDQVMALKTQADLTALFDRFAIRRTDPRFWQISDRIHDYWQASNPVAYGVLDYSRLDNE